MNHLDKFIEIANNYEKYYNERLKLCKHYTDVKIDHILYKYIDKALPEYEDIGSEELRDFIRIISNIGSWNAVRYIRFPFDKTIPFDIRIHWAFSKHDDYASILRKAREVFDKRDNEIKLIRIKQHEDEFNTLERTVERLTTENQLLKEQNLMLERAFNPNIKYNYTEIKECTSIFKQELLSKAYVFIKMFKARSFNIIN